MNKRLLLACALLSAASSTYAQTSPPIDPATKLITYAEVIQVPGASHAELYARATRWFRAAFNSSKEVVRADKKEAGIVQGTGWRTIRVAIPTVKDSASMRLWYTVKITVQTSGYGYAISGFQDEFLGNDGLSTPIKFPSEAVLNNPTSSPAAIAFEVKKNADEAALVGASIKKGMSKPAAGSDF